MAEAQDPGKLEWLVSCDESGTGGAKYYGFGSLWMKYQRRGDFAHDFQLMRDKHGYFDECKWSRVSKKSLPFVGELVDYFFKRQWLAFHCIVVRKGIVDKAYHKGDYDLARRKQLTMLLTNKIKRCMKAHPTRQHTFRIYVDPIASRYAKADEAVEVIANNVLQRLFGPQRPIDKVITRDSKDTPTIQLCDLLLGAVMDAWQRDAQSEAKIFLQKGIADYLSWGDLQADTFDKERKFNIWYFYDPTRGAREVKTRRVRLKYPLPNIM